MRNFMSILVSTALIFSSCGGSQSTEDKIDELNEVMADDMENSNFKVAKDCDEFIDQYDKWMDDYIKVIDKYMNDPMDATVAEEFQKVALEGVNWMTQWTSNLTYCASEEKYQKRFDEISDKAEKKLKEMGID